MTTFHLSRKELFIRLNAYYSFLVWGQAVGLYFYLFIGYLLTVHNCFSKAPTILRHYCQRSFLDIYFYIYQ